MAKLTPMKAIRAKCRECKNNSSKQIADCEAVNCPLHDFRFGKNPNIKPREMTEEQRAAAAERLRAYRKG